MIYFTRFSRCHPSVDLHQIWYSILLEAVSQLTIFSAVGWGLWIKHFLEGKNSPFAVESPCCH